MKEEGCLHVIDDKSGKLTEMEPSLKVVLESKGDGHKGILRVRNREFTKPIAIPHFTDEETGPERLFS